MVFRKESSGRRKSVGISINESDLARITVLAGNTGQRSQFIIDTLALGLDMRFGPKWREMADRLITEREREGAAA